MSVCLVSYVPDDAVVWCVVDIMQCHGDFHDSQTGGEVSRVGGQLFDDIFPKLFTELWKLVHRQFLEVVRRVDILEQF